jgi:nucleotide-binding universal stress UspA family protein
LARGHSAVELAAAFGDLRRATEWLQREDTEVTMRAVAGSVPAVEITSAAEAYGAGVIVMATHGRGGLARSVLGSVAAETLRLARVPVLLVRPAAMQPRNVQPGALDVDPVVVGR